MKSVLFLLKNRLFDYTRSGGGGSGANRVILSRIAARREDARAVGYLRAAVANSALHGGFSGAHERRSG